MKVAIFRCFNVFSVRPPQKFQVQAKISTIRPVFPDDLSAFYDYDLSSRSMHTEYFGTDTISSLGPKLWKLIPNMIKHASTLSAFKAKIKSWSIINCSCRLFKIFAKDIGFVGVCPRVSNRFQTNAYSLLFFKKTFLKGNLEHSGFFLSWTYNPHKKSYMIVNTKSFLKKLTNMYYI